MGIPTYDQILLPLLKELSDGRERSMRELREAVAKTIGITEPERRVLLPGGTGFMFDNRVGWARTYLKKAGLVELPKKGFAQITEKGRELLARNPSVLGIDDLMVFPEFKEFVGHSNLGSSAETSKHIETIENATPEERLQSSFAEIQTSLRDDILKRLHACSPEFFELLVLDVLVKMGYGGSLGEAQHVGRSGDGGIDGLIKADPLGLNQIYVQAKRWVNKNVGRPDIQGFVGALEEHGARQGVFITTSEFTCEASDYANRITQKRVILINGQELADLMIRFGVGVTVRQTFQFLEVDSDYFAEG